MTAEQDSDPLPLDEDLPAHDPQAPIWNALRDEHTQACTEVDTTGEPGDGDEAGDTSGEPDGTSGEAGS